MPYNLKSLVIERDESIASLARVPEGNTYQSTRVFWQQRVKVLTDRLKNFGKRYNLVMVSYRMKEGEFYSNHSRFFTDVTLEDAQLFILGSLSENNTEIIDCKEIPLGL